jgi:hypothetical protein
MLAGDRPFLAETTQELRAQVVAGTEALSVLQFAPALPREAGEILGKALQKQPEHRFQTAAEFRDALLGLEALLTRPPPAIG